jgi:hypothetical protein
VLLEICGVDHHDLLVLAFGECLVALLVDTLTPDANAVPDRLSTRDLKGLVRPPLDRDRHPRGLVAPGEAIEEVPRNCHWISPKLLLDDAGVQTVWRLFTHGPLSRMKLPPRSSAKDTWSGW